MIARTPIPEQAASARVLVLGADRPQRVHSGFAGPGPANARILAVCGVEAVPADFDPEVLVVPAGLAEPRRTAAEFRREHPATQILFAIPPEQTERFQASLPFTPDLAGAAVIATTASADELAAALTRLAATARHERGIRGLYARLNTMLAAGGAPAERKEADAERQRQLVLAERYLGTILAQSPQALFATDRTGNFLQRNAAAQRLFGRSRRSLLEHFPADARRDLERVLHLAGQGRHPDMIELVLPEEGGSEKWIQLKAAPILSAGGTIEALSFSAQDVTERRHAERALEETARSLSTMANAIPQLAWTANPRGEAEWYNDRWYAFTGRGSETLGRGWAAVLHPDHAERVIAGLQKHLVSGEPWEDRFPIRAADGSYRWFLTRAVPMHDAEGRLLRWFGTNTDITEQMEAERALRELTETLEQRVVARTRELQAANEALVEAMQKREAVEERVRQMQKLEAVGQLTGGIAHDFNNMLAVIINSLEVIKLYHERGRTDVGQFIESARKAGMRAATLTRSLLAFARRQPLSPQPADANKLISNMAALLNSTLRENIAVQYVLAPDLWLTHVDVSQLENALLNLAVNARDAMPEGGRVIIETTNVELDAAEAARQECKPGAYVSVTVSDTGHGMSPEVAKRAFDPFYTTKEVGQGTGLGLSQVLGFVQQSGGHVSIESAPGRGTSVRLHLPRFAGESEAGAAPQAEDPVSSATHGERILLVEDDDGVRELMTQVLADLGYKVIAAAGPLAALRLLDENADLDLLLTDVVMPEMNGRKLADEALRRRPRLKVLFTSGYPRDAVVHNGVIDPGVHFLPKPATSEQIARKVRAVLST